MQENRYFVWTYSTGKEVPLFFGTMRECTLFVDRQTWHDPSMGNVMLYHFQAVDWK